MNEEWITKIIDLIQEESLEFIDRKDKCLPKYLFKYRSVDDYSISSLLNDTLWFDHPANFNDPYDCSVNFTGDIIDDYINNLWKTISEKAGIKSKLEKQVYNFYHSSIIEKFDKAISNSCLVCCFSSNVNSMLMWSHYANSHKGFCIAYDISKLDKNNIMRKNLYPVIYKKEKFDVSYYLDSAICPKYPAIAGLCWKSREWSYEDEYRIILPCKDNIKEPKLFNVLKPSAIFLGSKIDQKSEEKIENIALDRKIEVYKAECDSKSFTIAFNKLLFKRRED